MLQRLWILLPFCFPEFKLYKFGLEEIREEWFLVLFPGDKAYIENVRCVKMVNFRGWLMILRTEQVRCFGLGHWVSYQIKFKTYYLVLYQSTMPFSHLPEHAITIEIGGDWAEGKPFKMVQLRLDSTIHLWGVCKAGDAPKALPCPCWAQQDLTLGSTEILPSHSHRFS